MDKNTNELKLGCKYQVIKGVVEHQSQPTNPFNRKDLTIPEWATHTAQDGDTGC